jgi:septum site-determining protein MinD
MAGYVCTVAGGKGGVGKTTTAINIGAALQENGHETVVVDADLGMANLGKMLDIPYDTSIHDVLAGTATVKQGLTDTEGGLAVLPGEATLEAFAEADPAKLRDVLQTLRADHDVVLVDTGGGLSHEMTVPLGLADGILFVTTPNHVAVDDTLKTADLARRVDGEVIGTLINRVSPETNVPDIPEQFDMPLLGAIPSDTKATEREPLVHHSPDTRAAEAYRRLTASLERVYFEGAAGSDLERVFDRDWFTDNKEGSAEKAASDGEESDGEADASEKGAPDGQEGPDEKEESTESGASGGEESDGVFGGLFR